MGISNAGKVKKLEEQIAQVKADAIQKTKKLNAAKGKLEASLARRQRSEDTHRKIQKGGLDESLFAFVHMTKEQHLDFLIELLNIPGVREFITKTHLATGGKQYHNPEQFDEYANYKINKQYADWAKAKARAEAKAAKAKL